MKYESIFEGRFLRRLNRFVAVCEIEGREERVHVRNTSRCAELFLPGVEVFLQYAPSPEKKTAYTLIALRKGERLVNLDSLAPNKLVVEFLREGGILPGMNSRAEQLRAEAVYGHSRLDCYFVSDGTPAYVEVKGVTLEQGGKAYFPDAPTLRGLRHVQELCQARQEGFLAYLFLVIQMEGIASFAPNYATHPAFGEALTQAAKQGVQIIAYDCSVAKDEIRLRTPVAVNLADRSSETWKQ